MNYEIRIKKTTFPQKPKTSPMLLRLREIALVQFVLPDLRKEVKPKYNNSNGINRFDRGRGFFDDLLFFITRFERIP